VGRIFKHIFDKYMYVLSAVPTA